MSRTKKQAYHTSMMTILPVPCHKISAGLPITSKVDVKAAWPTGLNALHEYVPECSEPAPWRISKLIFEVIVFIMNLDVEMRGISSLYHWSVMGSSPFMTVQGTWRGCPSFTSGGNENGRISGRSVWKRSQLSSSYHFFPLERLWEITKVMSQNQIQTR